MQELDEKCENRKKIPTKRLALAGILLAAALVLSLVESLIPPIIPRRALRQSRLCEHRAYRGIADARIPVRNPYHAFEMRVHRRVFGQYVFACVLDSRRVCRVHRERTHFQNSEDGDYCRQRHFGHDSQLCTKRRRKYRHRQKRVAFVAVSYADRRDCGVGDRGYCVCFIESPS